MKDGGDLTLQEPAYREIIEPGGRWSMRLETGDQLRIVDLEGQQAVDFLCYSGELPLDRLNVPNTVKLNRSLYVTKGTTIYSDRARKMFSVLDDTCGFHDTLAGCCSHEMDFLRYGVHNKLSCPQQLRAGTGEVVSGAVGNRLEHQLLHACDVRPAGRGRDCAKPVESRRLRGAARGDARYCCVVELPTTEQSLVGLPTHACRGHGVARHVR
jgi:hypothetical protein